MRCDECGTDLYQPGDIAPAGTYVRVDDGSSRKVTIARPGPLPATFDGHIATYRGVAPACTCSRSGVPGAIAAPAPALSATSRAAGGHHQA